MRKTPSIKALCAAWPEVPVEAWKAWKAMARDGKRQKVMEAANVILGGHGVESIFNQSLSDPCGLYYVNLGDPYVTTLRLHDSGTIDAGTWGDWVESMERRGVRFD